MPLLQELFLQDDNAGYIYFLLLAIYITDISYSDVQKLTFISKNNLKKPN